MKLGEAQAIGVIIATADGGCISCAQDLADQLNAAFPEYVWEPDKDWDSKRVVHVKRRRG